MDLPFFDEYSSLFAAHGHSLYLVGGTSRDVLLGLAPSDFDFATEATPQEEMLFLPDADYSFARFGSIKVKKEGKEIDITTFRIDGEYADFRHPSTVAFVSSPKEDSVRRDFTINALYMDSHGRVYDFHDGLADLSNKIIRFIGDPDKRVKEDPLRILRAERFAKRLGFGFDPLTKKAIEENRCLLKQLNQEKVRSEERKG
jgi:tRNA nucleotidyltransferase (CCA-adding enzyme)